MEDERKKLQNLYETLRRRTGLAHVGVQNLFKIISQELGSIPSSLFQEDITESDEFKRLKTNLAESLEAYRLEVYKLFDAKVHEHKENAEKYMK
jgi:hypothetical protein